VNLIFGASAVVAVAATIMVITRRNAVHALLYLVVSFLAVAVIMLLLGAAFVAALEIIIYAGAIMVLFVFVVMLIGHQEIAIPARAWIGPAIMGTLLLAEVAWVIVNGAPTGPAATAEGPKAVGMSLFGPYIVGTEISAFLLLAGLVGAFHLGRREGRK